MSASGAGSDAAEAGSSALSTVGRGLGLGGVAGGAGDYLEGNGFDRIGNAVASAARSGGDVLGAVNDLVNRVTPDFIHDLIPQGAGEAGEAAGMLVPYAMDALAVVV